MGKTAFSGPVLGDFRALGGAGELKPIEFTGRADNVFYWNDFLTVADYNATDDFSLTQVSANGSADFTTSETGVLRLAVEAANDGPIIQLDGNSTGNNLGITPAAAVAGTSVASDAMCVFRIACRDADATDFFVGFADNPASEVLTAAGALTSDNHAGFHLLDANDGVILFSAAGTADTSALTTTNITTLSDDTFVELGVRVTGVNRARGYLRVAGGGWRKVADITTTNNYDGRMFITMAAVGVGSGDDLDVDYIGFSKLRDLTEGP